MDSMPVCMSSIESKLTVRIVKNLSVVKRVYLYIYVFVCVLLIAEVKVFKDNIFDRIMFRFDLIAPFLNWFLLVYIICRLY